MITKKIYILYQPGSHGSYLRWLVDYCNDIGHRHKTIIDNPTAKDGSAHYIDNFDRHIGATEIIKTTDKFPNFDHGYIIYRCLPILHNDNIRTDEVISSLVEKVRDCDKIIYINVDTQYLKELTFINIELKADYKPSLQLDLQPLLYKWGLDTSNFFEAERWVQREILSLWFRGMINSLTSKPKIYENVLYIDMQDILFTSNFDLAKKLIEFCDLPFRPEIKDHILNVQDEFLKKQQAIKYHQNMRDTLINCLENKDAPIHEMSLFTEAILQEQLLVNGYSLKCYGLNQLPKTTGELLKLLEKC